jgi:hypothetical protein
MQGFINQWQNMKKKKAKADELCDTLSEAIKRWNAYEYPPIQRQCKQGGVEQVCIQPHPLEVKRNEYIKQLENIGISKKCEL